MLPAFHPNASSFGYALENLRSAERPSLGGIGGTAGPPPRTSKAGFAILAYAHEIDRWSRRRTRTLPPSSASDSESTGSAVSEPLSLENGPVNIAGCCQGIEYSGSIEHLFDWSNRMARRRISNHASRALRSSRPSPSCTSKSRAGLESWPGPKVLIHVVCTRDPQVWRQKSGTFTAAAFSCPTRFRALCPRGRLESNGPGSVCH
jgi:hypothetical protein